MAAFRPFGTARLMPLHASAGSFRPVVPGACAESKTGHFSLTAVVTPQLCELKFLKFPRIQGMALPEG